MGRKAAAVQPASLEAQAGPLRPLAAPRSIAVAMAALQLTGPVEVEAARLVHPAPVAPAVRAVLPTRQPSVVVAAAAPMAEALALKEAHQTAALAETVQVERARGLREPTALRLQQARTVVAVAAAQAVMVQTALAEPVGRKLSGRRQVIPRRPDLAAAVVVVATTLRVQVK